MEWIDANKTLDRQHWNVRQATVRQFLALLSASKLSAADEITTSHKAHRAVLMHG